MPWLTSFRPRPLFLRVTPAEHTFFTLLSIALDRKVHAAENSRWIAKVGPAHEESCALCCVERRDSDKPAIPTQQLLEAWEPRFVIPLSVRTLLFVRSGLGVGWFALAVYKRQSVVALLIATLVSGCLLRLRVIL